jgi:hypothetical protein
VARLPDHVVFATLIYGVIWNSEAKHGHASTGSLRLRSGGPKYEENGGIA